MTPDDLYALPLDEFVASRDRLARELADAGDPDEAKRVKTLRKPSVTAAALNDIARRRPDLITALTDSHRRLRSADSAATMRAASEARMAAIAQIVDAPGDVSEAVRRKMRSTLLAAATEPGVEDRLVAGRLASEAEPTGLGGFGLAVEFAADGQGRPDEPPSGKPATTRRSAKEARARERAERLGHEAEDAAAEAKALRQEAERADRAATAAEARAARARAAADKARAALGGR